ncbi:peptidase MA family metallohydrolase [Desulfofundulus sp.]|uniref:peptidase MA family metallohydrolase n=1 Tax=Desulfofundulus sp. TaxID=2282750 RepID=UPI003C70CE93
MNIYPFMTPQPSSGAGQLFIWFWLRMLAIFMAFTFFLALRLPGQVRACLYNIFREASRAQVMISTRHLPTLSDGHFVVRYYPGDDESARLVLKSAREFYPLVARDFRFDSREKIPVIVHPTRESLNASFGWPASESAMGVYWAGVIRVLSPTAWIDARDSRQIEEVFNASGPVAHELTHLVVDYITRGNVPRWFTEGVAQYEEYRLTGFRLAGTSEFAGQPLYDFKEMERDFDRLPNQTLAYWQSLEAVEYLVDVYGDESLHKILAALGQGDSMDTALKQVTGQDLDCFAAGLRSWLGQKQAGNN